VIWACKGNSALKVANKKEMIGLDWGITMIIGLGDEIFNTLCWMW
jgi:hypothetical protein